jgi:hypothetical protein
MMTMFMKSFHTPCDSPVATYPVAEQRNDTPIQPIVTLSGRSQTYAHAV